MPNNSDTRSQLTGAMHRLVDDPDSYNQFIDAWHKHISAEVSDMDVLVKQPNRDIDFDGVADVAQETLLEIAKRDNDGELRDDVAHMLNSFPHAAFLVGKTGIIHALNDLAFIENEVDIGGSADDIGYILERSETIIEAVAAVIANSDTSKNVVLKRGFGVDGKRSVTFAFIISTPVGPHDERVLMFVVDPVWRKEAGTLMQSAFGFTNAEADVVDGFMSGDTLRQIADGRDRAHTTVRTQFQKLMEKAGVKNQLELMRVALGLSQFVGEIEPIAKVALQPQRRRVDVLRPKNRSVDVLFYGDPDGLPVVFIQSLFFRSFPSFVEMKFKQAGLNFIAPGRPGFGNSSPPPANEDILKCIVGDVEAILDQMGIDKCVLIGQTVGSPASFGLCDHLSHRISHAIIIGSAAPAIPEIVLDTKNFGSSWTAAVAKAAKISPNIAYLVGRAAHRLMLSSGTVRLVTQHYNGSESDLKIFSNQDVIREFESGISFMVKQGIEPAVDGIISCFEDWSLLVENAKVPITLAHGTQDPHAPIQTIRSFCKHYPEKLTLQEFEDGGQLLMISHTDEIIKLIKRTSLKKIPTTVS